MAKIQCCKSFSQFWSFFTNAIVSTVKPICKATRDSEHALLWKKFRLWEGNVRLLKSSRHWNENTNIERVVLNIAFCSHKFYSETCFLYMSNEIHLWKTRSAIRQLVNKHYNEKKSTADSGNKLWHLLSLQDFSSAHMVVLVVTKYSELYK